MMHDLNKSAAPYRGIPLQELVAMIDAHDAEIVRLDRLAGTMARPRPPEYWKLKRQQDSLSRESRGMSRAAALDYGASRGWSLSGSDFSLRVLADGKQHGGWRDDPYGLPDHHDCFDHPYFYRRNRKAAAIVAHLYGWPVVRPKCEAIVAQFGLTLELPDLPSWWNADGCTMVVYVGPAGRVPAGEGHA